MSKIEYPFELKPLTDEEGGGWMISFPDLPGCISDGETPEEAIANGEDALNCWIDACKAEGRSVPEPGELSNGKIVTKIPKSLQIKLAVKAKEEGVSLSALVSSYLAECLARA
jgi:antitoxin HicB